MNASHLFTLGTPFGGWQQLVQSLAGPMANVCSLDAAQAERLTAQSEDARFLIWVESPAQALAHWLEQGGQGDAAHVLALWLTAAKQIERLVQLHLPRCLVVLAEEARAQPREFASLLKRWLGLKLDNSTVAPATPPAASAAPDPLATLLTERVAAQNAACMRAFSGLYASCVALVEGEPTAGSAAQINPVAAISNYQELSRRAAGTVALREHLAQAEKDLETSRQDHQALAAELAKYRQAADAARDASVAQIEDLHAEKRAATQENELLLLQLHQVQEELERHYLEHKASAAATAATNQKAAQEKIGAEAASSRQAEQAASTARAASASQLEELRTQQQAAAQENELLLLQLHQVQEELEHYYLAWRELSTKVVATAGTSRFEVGRVEIGTERDSPPHRELCLVLHQVQAGGRKLPQVHARLVEHHGRPGIAFFEADGTEPALAAWRPNGHEGERGYMLLVPADEAARPLLQHMGRADWDFTEAVAATIERALQESPTAASARWQVVAARLRQQLAELPTRLRYDSLDVAPAADAQGALDCKFGNLSFGRRRTDAVRVRWWPQRAGGAALELLAPESDSEAPSWAAWPMDDSGAPQPAWHLPLGDAAPALRKQAWRALGTTDREMLLGLLDALPAAAERAQPHAEGLAPSALVAAAQQPLRIARAAIHGTRLRRTWRALRGRIGA